MTVRDLIYKFDDKPTKRRQTELLSVNLTKGETANADSIVIMLDSDVGVDLQAMTVDGKTVVYQSQSGKPGYKIIIEPIGQPSAGDMTSTASSRDPSEMGEISPSWGSEQGL